MILWGPVLPGRSCGGAGRLPPHRASAAALAKGGGYRCGFRRPCRHSDLGQSLRRPYEGLVLTLAIIGGCLLFSWLKTRVPGFVKILVGVGVPFAIVLLPAAAGMAYLNHQVTDMSTACPIRNMRGNTLSRPGFSLAGALSGTRISARRTETIPTPDGEAGQLSRANARWLGFFSDVATRRSFISGRLTRRSCFFQPLGAALGSSFAALSFGTSRFGVVRAGFAS